MRNLPMVLVVAILACLTFQAAAADEPQPGPLEIAPALVPTE